MTRGTRLPLTTIRTRLLLIALVPLVAFGALVRSNLAHHRSTRSTAERVRAHLASTIAVDRANSKLRQEELPSEMMAWSARLGISIDIIEQLTAIPVRRQVAEARAALDADNEAVAELRNSGLLPDLYEVRQALDRGSIDPLDLRDVFYRLRAPSQLQWKIDLNAAHRLLADLPSTVVGTTALERSVSELERTSDLYEAADTEVATLTVVLLGSADRAAARINLAKATQSYQLALQRLIETDPETRSSFTTRLDAQGAPREFSNVVAQQLASSEPPTQPEIAAALRGGLIRSDIIQTYLTDRLAAATAAATALTDQAQADHQRQFNALVAVTAIAALVALLIARSIARPLQALQRRAAAVSNGDVHHEQLPLRGAREVAVAARGFNDAVATLHTIEQQAEALAAGDTEAAAIVVPAPGHLGTMMHASVARLTASLEERDALETRLAHEASHDALTGLINRRALLDRVDALLADDPTVVLVFFDLDGFKQTNDGFGHSAGDTVLQVVAQRLVKTAPPSAIVARLGGDEFVVVITSSETDPVARPQHELASELATSMIAAVTGPICVGDERHQIGACAGVAVSTAESTSSSMLRDADIALYRAKDRGTNQFVVFDDTLRAELARRHRVASELRAGIGRGELEVYFQPLTQSSLETGSPLLLHGVEALVRWNHPSGHQVPPNDFIDIAEESNLIVDIDLWVMREAMTQVVRWRRGPFPDLHLSCNASGRTLFTAGFIESLRDDLIATGLPTGAFTLELTETVLLNDLDRAAQTLEQVRALGASVAIDDFGTGYTSIAQLRQLPIDRLKIDRSFVSNLHLDQDRSIVDLVISVGHSLGCEIVAEGVETEDQRDFLTLRGCELLQGYLLGRPCNVHAFEASFAPGGHGELTGITNRPPAKV
ncbi:MAG: putative bifunctional diguanylate cyclase/phosphodiesterase [Acidimicrobiia bacterium]